MSETIRLGDVCAKIGSGATPRGGKDTYSSDGPYALIRSQNIYNDNFAHDGLVFISEQQAAQLSNVEVQADDVLLNITGDSVARVCQVDKDVLPARVNQHVAIIRPDPEILDAEFLRYFLVTPEMQAYMLAMASAGATRNALTKSMIENFRVPTRSMLDQKAIASILGSLDDKIDLNRQMNETLEQTARGLFRDWFVDFGPTKAKMAGQAAYLEADLWDLFPERLDEVGIPEGWNRDRLGAHLQNFDSKRIPVSGAERRKRQGTYPYHGAAGVMDYVDGYIFDDIFVLIGEDGSVKTPTGLAVTQYVWGKLWVNNHAHVLQGKGVVSTEQILCYFAFEAVEPYVTGAVQPKLSQGRMNSMPFTYAGERLCSAFSKLVDPLFARIRASSEENIVLAQTRDLLLPKLMSGELRVRDIERICSRLFR